MRCCRDYWRWRMPFRCCALRRRISIRYFSCCGWIIRRFSGRPATSTGIIRSRRILCSCRNTSLKSKIREHQKAMKARVEKLARAAQNLSEWEKEKYVHDFICENVHYDKLKKPYSHEIIGPLGQGVGVCEGIAKSVKVLCDALGIWCVIALCGNCPEKGIKYRHTWNIVKIGGQYYHLDATFDNTLGAGAQIRYDYFNLCDKSIFRDHQPLIAPAPECTDAAHFYYREKKRFPSRRWRMSINVRFRQQKRKNVYLSLERRVSHQGGLWGTVGTDFRGRQGERKKRQSQRELAAGGDPV